MIPAFPQQLDLVLVGGGHSHVIVLRQLAMQPIPGVRVTVVARDLHAPYSGMLPGLVAGHYGFDDAHIDVGRLGRVASARVVHDTLVGLDRTTRTVRLASGRSLRYDVLSLNTGIEPDMSGLAVAPDALVLPVKPIARFLPAFAALQRQLVSDGGGMLTIVGAGVGGVELSLAVRHALDRNTDTNAVSVRIIAGGMLLPEAPLAVRERVRQICRAARIELVEQAPVAAIERTTLKLADGRRLANAAVLVATGAAPPPWTAHAALDLDDAGFVRVTRTLQTTNDARIFASGDIASLSDARPKAGVFAVRAGGVLANNLRRVLLARRFSTLGGGSIPHRRLQTFRPQRRFLVLLSLGGQRAIGWRQRAESSQARTHRPLRPTWTGRWPVVGRWVWRWKNSIDRRFMARFADLTMGVDDLLEDDTAAVASLLAGDGARTRAPTARLAQIMRAPATAARRWRAVAAAVRSALPPRLNPKLAPEPSLAEAAEAMRCGGCGAKLAADLLAGVLGDLPTQSARGVLAGLGDRDDAAVLAASTVPIAVTVDGFRSPLADPYVFGQLAANHALGDSFAMAAQPLHALALATVPHAADALMADDLRQLMLGATGFMNPLGVALVGGHSAEGAELSLGLTVLAAASGSADCPAAPGEGAGDGGSATISGAASHPGWLSKSGLRPGDALVLTKPVGTGVLLAGDMRGAVRSRWLSVALAAMLKPLDRAAAIARDHGATAATDVTGFGLLGHLAEMARGGDCGIEVWLDQVPVYDGALATMAAGIVSSLQDGNERVLDDLTLLDGLRRDDPLLRLMVDPQTCGGLVFSLPLQRVGACLAALHRDGVVHATYIGQVLSRPPDGGIGQIRRQRPSE